MVSDGRVFNIEENREWRKALLKAGSDDTLSIGWSLDQIDAVITKLLGSR
jgi:hypothetical protein